jgi:DNA-nicking Smr family endonuclease
MTARGDKPRLRNLSKEERALWESIVRTAAPLRRKPAPSPVATAKSDTPKPKVTLQMTSRQTVAAHAPSPEPLDRRLRQRLARGTAPIDKRIDLHGLTQSEAHSALLRFLRKAQGEGARFALVITGKGAAGRPGEPGVLRRQVPLWLKLPEFRRYVIGFETAHASHGGEGAIYVRVRRARAAAIG